jgi:hypothetical protein
MRNAHQDIVMPMYHVLVREVCRMYFHQQVRLGTQLLILHQVTSIAVWIQEMQLIDAGRAVTRIQTVALASIVSIFGLYHMCVVFDLFSSLIFAIQALILEATVDRPLITERITSTVVQLFVVSFCLNWSLIINTVLRCHIKMLSGMSKWH